MSTIVEKTLADNCSYYRTSKNGKVSKTVDASAGCILLDYDANGAILGMEALDQIFLEEFLYMSGFRNDDLDTNVEAYLNSLS